LCDEDVVTLQDEPERIFAPALAKFINVFLRLNNQRCTSSGFFAIFFTAYNTGNPKEMWVQIFHP